jgi:alpha-glucosidase
MDGLRVLARDHSRLPMQWDDSPQAGFTTGEPWMRTHDLYREINVKKQEADPESVLSFWKKALQLRKEYRQLFIHGAFEVLDFGNQEVFCFVKSRGEEQALVILNFTSTEQPCPQSEMAAQMKLLISNYAATSEGARKLQPYEGRIYLAE